MDLDGVLVPGVNNARRSPSSLWLGEIAVYIYSGVIRSSRIHRGRLIADQ